MADNAAPPVSNSPLVPVVKHAEEIRAWLGAIAMGVFAYVLWRILTGKDSIAGETEFQGLKYAWLLFVWPAVHGFFIYQDWVSMTRPTGGQKGFWYGLLDFLPSAAALVVVAVALASWIVPSYVVPVLEAWGLPTAPYATEKTFLAAVVLRYALPDVILHFRRARHGRDALIAENVKAALPPDREASIVSRAEYPHGYAIIRRKENGGLELPS